jgi:isopentenyl diphosphate isomerase/L-lactate dehydrogenase-like FMN-dependent dehydrogenase
VLVDVSSVSTETTVLGGPVSMPLLVAPIAFQRLVDPDGEVAMARAAAAAGTVMTLSTAATSHPSEIAAEAPPGRRWFQLYCLRDRGVTRALIDEAVESDFEAIVLTVDAPRAGRRERDFRTGFAVPAEVTVPAVAAAIGDGQPITPKGLFELVDPALDWDDFAALASDCGLPVLLKGIQTAEDAALAVEHGAAGVIVSNHGGRQLDNVAPSLEVLPEVVEAVGGRCEVLMDGGVRRGTDVVIALALGARAVLAGRAPLWGLAVGGEAGARRVLELLRAEVELALTLLGCPTPHAVTREHVSAAVNSH